MALLKRLFAGLIAVGIISSAAFAGAAGGATELPANAEKQQMKGSAGSANRPSGAATSSGSATSVDFGEKGTATGGNAGGTAGRN